MCNESALKGLFVNIWDTPNYIFNCKGLFIFTLTTLYGLFIKGYRTSFVCLLWSAISDTPVLLCWRNRKSIAIGASNWERNAPPLCVLDETRLLRHTCYLQIVGIVHVVIIRLANTRIITRSGGIWTTNPHSLGHA